MSPFLHDRIVLRPMNTPLPIVIPRFDVSLGVDQAVVVDDDIVADADLVRMAQHDVLSEHDVTAARAEQQRIRASCAATSPSAPGMFCDSERDEFVLR